jgi:hypothetical protein
MGMGMVVLGAGFTMIIGLAVGVMMYRVVGPCV